MSLFDDSNSCISLSISIYLHDSMYMIHLICYFILRNAVAFLSLFCFSQALRCICSASLRSSQRRRLPVAPSLHCRSLGRRVPSSLRCWPYSSTQITNIHQSSPIPESFILFMRDHKRWFKIIQEKNVLKSSKINGLKFEPCTYMSEFLPWKILQQQRSSISFRTLSPGLPVSLSRPPHVARPTRG